MLISTVSAFLHSHLNRFCRKSGRRQTTVNTNLAFRSGLPPQSSVALPAWRWPVAFTISVYMLVGHSDAPATKHHIVTPDKALAEPGFSQRANFGEGRGSLAADRKS